MSIESDIKQSKFRDPRQRAVINVMYTAGWLESRILQWLKPHDLTPQQYNVLRILRGSAPKLLSMGDITSRMLDRQSNVSRLVEKLRLKKLLERKTSSKDRRAVEIQITKHGLELLSILDEQEIAWYPKLKGLDGREAKTLSDLLDKFRDGYEEKFHGPSSS